MSKPVILGIFFRNFQLYGGQLYDDSPYGGYSFSHVGLGVNAFNTAKVLREDAGIAAYPVPVFTVEHVIAALKKRPYTHVVLEALWIPTDAMSALLEQFPDIKFFVRAHSQIGFLQVEPTAISLLRDLLDLQSAELNLDVSANSARLKDFLQGVYNEECLLLPNLYVIPRPANRPHAIGGNRLIRISSFGSMRHLKLHSVAAAGALLLAERHGKDLEFHVSVHRDEHGHGALQAIRAMFASLPWATLVEDPWAGWAQFKRVVAHMDLGLQVSATETFNLTTADAVAEGVPCVVSTAIDWAPEAWKVDIDDAEQIARTGWNLLTDPHAPQDGMTALLKHQNDSLVQWQRVLALP